MGGKINAGVDVAQYSSVALASTVGERAHVERTLKSRLLSSCSMASSATFSPKDMSSASERMGDERSGGSASSASHEPSSHYDEAGLIRDGLQGLSFESGEDTDSAPEGIAASERSGSQAVENGVLSNPPELSRKTDTNISMDYGTTQQQQHGHSHAHALGHAGQYSGSPNRMARGLTHEYRPPPTLQLPDQTMMDSELAALHHQGRESDYAPSNFVLPATLAVSPSCHASCHDVKASLDPNAKEYTPAPSPCISPGVPPSLLQHHIGVPSSYSFESGHIFVSGVDNRSMMYSPTYGPDSAMSIYGNGSQLAFAPGSVTPAAPWGGIEVSDHQASQTAGGHLPLVQSSHPLRSFGIPPFQSMGLPSVGVSGQSVLSHPPISGREHVSRAILLNGVPASMTDDQLKIEMGKWGDVRTVVSDQKTQGLVTVNFYDLRCAKDALRDIQQQHLNKQQRMQQQFQLSQKQRGSASSSGSSSRDHLDMAHERQDSAKHSSDLLPDHNIGSFSIPATPGKGLIGGVVMWAQYTLPIGAAAGPDGMNQGTLVVFNLDVDTTMEHLKAVFEAYGDVKELRETPAKKQHKFVEFYDVRDASKALKALDGTEINGKRVKIEFSRPGGQAHKARVQLQQQAAHGTTVYHPIGGSRPSLAGSGPGAVAGQPFYLNWSGDAAGSPLTMPTPHGGASYLWASNIGTPVPPLGLAVPQPWSPAGSQLQTGLQTYNYASMQAGPASAAGPLVVMGNMEALSYGRAGSRAMALPFTGGSVSPVENYSSAQGFGRGSGSGPVRGDGVSSRRKRNSSVNGSAGGFGKVESGSSVGSGGKLREGPRVGTRISTNKLASQRADVPPQYVFDESGGQATDTQRTTLMIKNIPNKYSQQMLLSLLDNHCTDWNKRVEGTSEPESAYDFVYLPIDFKNRCNLGYAFVNFTTVHATKRLYISFHQQQWEEFNSRKVCNVTYARVQGRVALEEHFKNSRFACDTDEYLPLIFRPPRNGKNSSIPATVAAVHQSSRVPGNSSSSSSQDQELGKGPRNGERPGGDELSRRVLANGVSATAQEIEMELTGVQSRGGSSSGGHRSNMPQQHR